MKDAKKALRRTLRQSRPGGDDQRLCRNILSHPWFLAADVVMAYAALPDEPDLSPVLEEILKSGRRLALPRCGPDGTMTGHWIGSLGELTPGAYGIPEPPEDAPIAAALEIDLILAPGMAFDPSGGRLGRGKGYYDRFLVGYMGKTMGVCRQERLLAAVPMEEYDRRMDAVVTDEQVYDVERRTTHV